MPITLPANLPAVESLQKEKVFVMTTQRAITQDIRPLEIGILNLMPTKIETETQLLRLLSNTPLQLHITLLQMKSHPHKNTPKAHLDEFYCTFEQIKNTPLDGLIITGAPIENLPFDNVTYWKELCEVMEWAKTYVFSTLYICWGAMAGLYYHYGINKHILPHKLSGVYPHRVLTPLSRLMRGFDDVFYAPHSRNTEVLEKDLLVAGLTIMSDSPDAGVYIAASKNRRQFFVTGHSEYDRTTLNKEYMRDKAQGLNPAPPANYYKNNDPKQEPIMTWRSHAYLLFANWLNYYVYQDTPYDLKKL
ncbi:MAG: homoserine O-succinyltransferase [Defluviitaleaceae bacterium]|nr:homoserine O-succinyltransferase [Defluviitaleaceae bacterium]